MADLGLVRPDHPNGDGPPPGAYAMAVSVLILHENEVVVDVRVQRKSPAGLVILGTSRSARFKDVGPDELIAMLAAVGNRMQCGFPVPDPDEPGKVSILWMPVGSALFRPTPAPGAKQDAPEAPPATPEAPEGGPTGANETPAPRLEVLPPGDPDL